MPVSSARKNNFEPGLRIAEARESRHLSQTELGVRLGKSKLTIGRWERGTHPIPELAWPTLALVLGVELEWLKSGTGPKMRSAQMTTPGRRMLPELYESFDDIEFEKFLIDAKEKFAAVAEFSISPSRSLGIFVLKDCIGDLVIKLPSFTDNQVIFIANAIRMAMEQIALEQKSEPKE